MISFQGTFGAYSDLACRKFYKNYNVLPCDTFEETFESVAKSKSILAMIPVDNSIAGRVADIHFLIKKTNLKIIAEHYMKIEHHLLGLKDSKISDAKNVYSHVHALSQCKKTIKRLKLKSVNFSDTAGAAKFILKLNDKSSAAIASELSAKIYGLQILKRNIEDENENFTRFLVFSKTSVNLKKNSKIITSLIFNTRNIPASLYKSLGGFATNGINLTKLESYFTDNSFDQSSFLIDIESHPEDSSFKAALDELKYFSTKIKILGSYPASDFRTERK
tara:strand:- start:408 stop:1238 length:831 start_codon:yes stop_codon:yes gene_type:complete